MEEFKRVVVNLKERNKDQLSSAKEKDDLEDWDTFRHFVRIIQIVGELMIKYENLEETLEKQIQTNFIHKQRTRSTSTASTPTSLQTFQLDQLNQTANQLQHLNLLSQSNFKEYLLEDTERIKLNTLISIIESG